MIMVIPNDHADDSHDTCMLNVINMINYTINVFLKATSIANWPIT